MAAANPTPLLVDPYGTESDDEEGGADNAPAVENGRGAAVEVRFSDGVWRHGRLLQRVAGTEPPRWKVQFDDGQARDDISIADPVTPLRFDAGAYGSTVEVRVAGEWRRGRLVELVKGGDVWGVAFEDGGWVEDVLINSPDVRYAFTGRGARLGEKRGRGGNAGDVEGEKSRNRVGAEGQGKETHSGERPHVCGTCGKVFSLLGGLTKHMRRHAGEKPHVCETCGKGFSTSWELTAHSRTHTGEKPYVCETCGKAFSASSNLAGHLRTHSGERPHVCETCGTAFADSRGLSRHMRTHTGENSVCDTCGKSFERAKSLALHMRIHSAEESHVCETCGRTFSRAHFLVSHMRRHTGQGGVHVCKTCGKVFTLAKDLTRHMKSPFVHHA